MLLVEMLNNAPMHDGTGRKEAQGQQYGSNRF
jgi:hypothetical protein